MLLFFSFKIELKIKCEMKTTKFDIRRGLIFHLGCCKQSKGKKKRDNQNKYYFFFFMNDVILDNIEKCFVCFSITFRYFFCFSVIMSIELWRFMHFAFV